ncbi:hypothetical protein [Streptomyces sp. NPDC101455]|uniref:DprA-like winged helix domain-containing protein n=1 Tax=Streptomyces sp. NPDC101455 TaxID=3366142 RepID=UPI003823AAB7
MDTAAAHRTAPTPADLAHRQAPPAATPTPAPPYDRDLWERAVFASDLHLPTRQIAMWLAHYAGAAGHIAAGGPQTADRLAKESSVTPRATRLALTKLELDGFITRPDIHTWTHRYVRPITLTLPTASARTEPPHTGEAPE